MWNLLLSVALLGAVADFEAQSLDGQTVAGQIASLDARQVVLRSDAGETTLALGSLAALARRDANTDARRKAKLWVELVDGSGLAAVDYAVQGDTARLTLCSGVAAEMPSRNVQWVRFSAPAADDEKLDKQWTDIIATKATADLLVVRKNGALDYLEGVQGDVDADTCSFELDKEVIPVKRPKVEGIVYFRRAGAQLPEAVGQLATADGSRLALRAIELKDDAVHLTTPGGVAFDVPLSEVVRFDFSLGKIAFLSDLTVESATTVPYLDFKEPPAAIVASYQFRRDASFEGNPLRLDGKVYRKGLSLQSRSVLAYKLPGKFRLFKSVVGIDDSVRETGDVHVEIKGDGKVLWQGDIMSADAAQELEVDVAGVKRLEIVVDYGEDSSFGDWLDFADARVTK